MKKLINNVKSFNIMKEFVKRVIRWLATNKVLYFPIRILERVVGYAIPFSRNEIIISYNDPERSNVFNLIKKIASETEMLLAFNEAYQIFMAVKRTEKVKGDIAEVGVYKGGSAKLICEAKGNKTLHLFDTFEGIPKVDEIDQSHFFKGQFTASLEDVKSYLEKYKNVYFYKGVFPATAEPVKDKKFSFINLDVDTYESTLNCLIFFYSRMNQGGIIISHDYISAPGVKKAFDEFFKDKPEPIIELSGSQCLIVKT
ncbi:MAG: class I SAM-dependent methyltransferase [Flexilinea sp.]|nr:class I SAM-dependent methyltransferase [Flexilinea sp.]